MRLLLVRHGETHHNVMRLTNGIGESTLTEKGYEQARLIASRLEGEEISMIYCSDLERARQTASEIVKLVKAPVQFVAELRERDMGVFESKPYGSYVKFIDDNGLDRIHYRPDGGESIADAVRRVRAFYKECSERHRGETIVWISHGGIIKKMIAYANKAMHFDHHPDNCGLTIIEDDEGPRVRLFNCTKHLGVLSK